MATQITRLAECDVCHHKFQEEISLEPSPCPKCNSEFINVIMMITERSNAVPYDEFSAECMNEKNVLVSERQIRTDLNINAKLSVDIEEGKYVGESIKTIKKDNIQRKSKVKKPEEERNVALAFVEALNNVMGSSYILDDRENENGFDDGKIISTSDSPSIINLQARHLDILSISGLGKNRGEYKSTRDCSEYLEFIRSGISDKGDNKYQETLKGCTFLLLHCPVIIGKICRKIIDANKFDLKGFYGVWIVPFRDPPFPLHPENPVGLRSSAPMVGKDG